jgi:thymidylate synthase (FAD)
MKDDFYVPAPEDVALQSTDNKQGRSETAIEPAKVDRVRAFLGEGQKHAYTEYTSLIDQGIAREIARINLPLSLYTEIYWNIDLHNLFHFLELRLGAHAQKEIRLYAQTLLEITKKVVPRCCESFEKHLLGGMNFSKEEFAELKKRLGKGGESGLTGKALERFEEKLRSGENHS